MEIQRRALVQGAALATLSFIIDGAEVWLSPSEARAQGAPMSVLQPDEVETLEAVGGALLPGARKAGIANFVDNQLGVPPGDCLLMARIANVRPPFVSFYRAALGCSGSNVIDRERLPSNQATIDGEGVGDDGAGDGGAGMDLYFCSNGITSR